MTTGAAFPVEDKNGPEGIFVVGFMPAVYCIFIKNAFEPLIPALLSTAVLVAQRSCACEGDVICVGSGNPHSVFHSLSR